MVSKSNLFPLELCRLISKGELLGIRFKTTDGKLFDIGTEELESRGINLEELRIQDREGLSLHGELFITRYEHENKILVEDYSKNKEILGLVVDYLKGEYLNNVRLEEQRALEVRRQLLDVDVKKELVFLKKATLGLLNKKGISFDIKSSTWGNGSRHISIIIANASASGHMNAQRLELSYGTEGGNASVHFSNNSDREYYSWTREEVPTKIKELLNSPKGRANKEISKEDEEVNFYKLIASLHKQLFLQKDLFEMNVWKTSLYLYKTLDLEYKTLQNSISIHGGVGSTTRHDLLNSITTSVEFGVSPKDNIPYLEVAKDIAEKPNYPKGLYTNASTDMFVEAVTEQFKKAWNRIK